MKTILASLLLSTISLLGIAQSQSMEVTDHSRDTTTLLGNFWSIAEHDDSFSPEHPDSTSITYFVKIGQDSTINSVLYNKVEKSSDTLLLNWSLFGFVRYDSIGDIYYRGIDEIEFLLYSFNIQKFDTLALYGYTIFPQLSAYVYDQDSIIIDNVYRKRFHINYLESGFQEVWVEGIGSMSSFLRYITDHAIGNYITREVLCLHIDNDQVYQNPNYPGCLYFYPTPDFISAIDVSQSINIYPNPVWDQLVFESNSMINKLEIYSTSGQLLRFIASPQSRESIDMSHFFPGQYIIRAIGREEIFVRKFVVIR